MPGLSMLLGTTLFGLAATAARFLLGRWLAIGPDLRGVLFALAGALAIVGGWHALRGSIERQAVAEALAARETDAAAEAAAVNRGFHHDETALRDALRPGDGARRLSGDGRMFWLAPASAGALQPHAPAQDAAAGASPAPGG